MVSGVFDDLLSRTIVAVSRGVLQEDDGLQRRAHALILTTADHRRFAIIQSAHTKIYVQEITSHRDRLDGCTGEPGQRPPYELLPRREIDGTSSTSFTIWAISEAWLQVHPDQTPHLIAAVFWRSYTQPIVGFIVTRDTLEITTMEQTYEYVGMLALAEPITGSKVMLRGFGTRSSSL